MSIDEAASAQAGAERQSVSGYITWDRLRLIFLREGKLAGRAWAKSESDTPTAVRQHLIDLVQALGDQLSSFDEKHRDSLMKLFFASAKRARTDSSGDELSYAAMSVEAIQNRIHIERGVLLDESMWELTDAAKTAVAEIAANPDKPVEQAKVATIYKEIGRLCGPLWISGTSEGFPGLPDKTVEALKPAIFDRLEVAPIFNEYSHEFDHPTRESVLDSMVEVLVEALKASRQRYYYGRDPLAPLPADAVRREDEVNRRVEHRARLAEKAESALDTIVRPILTSYLSYMDGLIAAAEAAAAERTRELSAERAARGFARPEPQRYGVSARGAENWVADALRWLGLHDAVVTQQSNDGGVDVLANGYAVSVKHYAGVVPVEEVREIFGVAVASQRTPLLWTSGTLTASASQFADVAPVGVIRYDVETATWEALNGAGEEFLANR